MSNEPYLIAHVVRGEPAFDIAIKLQIGDEEGWIIPTSGHRAHPYWSEALDRAVDWALLSVNDNALFTSPPPAWPDHYPATAAPKGQGLIANLAERLGLVVKPKVTRR